MLRSSMQRFRTGVHARRRFFPSARHVHTPPPSSRPPPPRPPPPKYIRFATVYPFILLSIFTSLALNLSVQRTARETEGARHRAQISVLEKLLARLRLRSRPDAATARELTEREQDEIERELELVGLGRGRGKEAVSAEMSVKSDEATSWREVFLGKKGKGYEPEDDKTDWEAVFRQADEAERTKQQRPVSAAAAAVPPVPTLPPPLASPAPPPTQTAPASPDADGTPRPNPSKPVFL